MMKKIQKILTILAIASMSITIIFLISGVFGAKVFNEGVLLYLMLTFATISAASFFSFSCLSFYEKKKYLSIGCLALLGLTLIFSIIIYWSGFSTPEVFEKITVIVALITILGIIIIITNLKVKQNYLVLQTITYIIVILIDFVIILQVCGKDVLDNDIVSKLFIVSCLVAFALLCAISILARKAKDNDEYIKIKKSEYDELLNKIKELENKNNQ